MLVSVKRPARALATWFGCGLSPLAPGTVGSVGAVPLHFLLRSLHPAVHVAAVVAVSAVGIWCSDVVAEEEGEKDPQLVVIDEVAGTLIAMGLVRHRGLATELAALVVFRVLDIVKPGVIDDAQRAEPPGLGVMLDDLLAGLAAGALLRLVR